MENLIPVNNDDTEILSVLQKELYLASVDGFIDMFNSGIMNTKNQKTIDLARRVADSYKNLEFNEKYNKFTVLSREEFHLEELHDVIKRWLIIKGIQHVINEHKDDIHDDTLYFGKSGTYARFAFVRVEDEKSENDNEHALGNGEYDPNAEYYKEMDEEVSQSLVVKRISETPVFENMSEFQELFKENIDYNVSDKYIALYNVSTFEEYDDSFIEPMYQAYVNAR